ncbi:MAG: hypothetical protein AAGH53_11015 [Pseudomonadota bacterium]
MDIFRIGFAGLLFSSVLMSCGEEPQSDVEEQPQSATYKDILARNIERTITLPDGAYAMDEYARIYFLASNGVVHALYITFEEPQFKVGKSVWVDDENAFPLILDGGCSVVSVVYKIETGSFISVCCNGVA